MVPNERYPGPGRSSMNMETIPRYADAGGEGAGVSIDPRAAQNLGVRLASVTRGVLPQSLEATGVIAFNERQVAIVQTRSGGFVERTYRRAPGDVVAAGAPIADLMMPEWAGAQLEFLALRRTGEPGLAAAGRRRLELLGMPASVIGDVARTGRPQAVVTVRTPQGGVVQTLSVRQGMTLPAGATLVEINGLSPVWLVLSVPEAQAGVVRVGQPVSAELAAYPGRTFRGRVAAILPAAQVESRTLEVRAELPNPGGLLRPGMFATARLSPGDQRATLLVPGEAVIRTGERSLVMVAQPQGRYQPTEVRMGREAGGFIEILSGLQEGQRVVASGQFLIDSEANLAGVETRLIEEQAPRPATGRAPAAVGPVEGRGRVEAISEGRITLSHGPIPALSWPAMTMSFPLADPAVARGLQIGDQVTFGLQPRGDGYVVARVARSGTAR